MGPDSENVEIHILSDKSARTLSMRNERIIRTSVVLVQNKQRGLVGPSVQLDRFPNLSLTDRRRRLPYSACHAAVGA